MVATARITIRIFVAFPDCNETVARKDVKFKFPLCRPVVIEIGVKK